MKLSNDVVKMYGGSSGGKLLEVKRSISFVTRGLALMYLASKPLINSDFSDLTLLKAT